MTSKKKDNWEKEILLLFQRKTKKRILKKNAIGVIELEKKRVLDPVNSFVLIKKTTISSSQFLFMKYR